jgi:hypothetical protein
VHQFADDKRLQVRCQLHAAQHQASKVFRVCDNFLFFSFYKLKP